MATFTISAPCATNPYPNKFCMVYGSSDCTELCTSSGCSTTSSSSSTSTSSSTTVCVQPGGLTDYVFYASSSSSIFSSSIDHRSSLSLACDRWSIYYSTSSAFSIGYQLKVASLQVGQRVYAPDQGCNGFATSGFHWVRQVGTSLKSSSTITIAELELNNINGIIVSTIKSLQTCIATTTTTTSTTTACIRPSGLTLYNFYGSSRIDVPESNKNNFYRPVQGDMVIDHTDDYSYAMQRYDGFYAWRNIATRTATSTSMYLSSLSIGQQAYFGTSCEGSMLNGWYWTTITEETQTMVKLKSEIISGKVVTKIVDLRTEKAFGFVITLQWQISTAVTSVKIPSMTSSTNQCISGTVFNDLNLVLQPVAHPYKQVENDNIVVSHLFYMWDYRVVGGVPYDSILIGVHQFTPQQTVTTKIYKNGALHATRTHVVGKKNECTTLQTILYRTVGVVSGIDLVVQEYDTIKFVIELA